jgi:hypothetical protein
VKKFILVFSSFIFIFLSLSAQYSRDMEYRDHVTAGINILNTGSGHGPEMCLNAGMQKARKSMIIGVLYQVYDNRISGIDIQYRIYFGEISDGFYFTRNFKPYIQYDLIYHKVRVDASTLLLRTKATTIEVNDSRPGTIATIEHYVSAGIQCRIYGRIFMDFSAGLGVYLGSLDKIHHPDTPGIHRENHGFTGVAKIGLGYRIN